MQKTVGNRAVSHLLSPTRQAGRGGYHALIEAVQAPWGAAADMQRAETNLVHARSDQVHGDWLDDLRRSAFEHLIAGVRGAQRAGLGRLEAWAARQRGSDRALAQAVVESVRGVSEALISVALAISGAVVGFTAGIVEMIRGLLVLLIGALQGILLTLYSLIDGGERLSAWARPIIEGLRQLPRAISALVDAWLVEFQAADTDRQTFMIGELTGQILALLASLGGPARAAGSVSRLSAAITVPARELVTAREIVLVPARTITVSVDVASPVAAAGFSGAVMLRVRTPSGTVTPQRGPYAGRGVSFGDPRGKHTRVGGHTISELADVARARSAPQGGDLRRFWDAVRRGDVNYGGQLGSEAIARYGELVLAALEKGVERAGKFFHEAAYEVGIDISTGRPTRRYRVDGAPNGAHIIPIE